MAFVSNPAGCVAMWQQRAAAPGEPIGWDYHVVLLVPGADGWAVHDPDSRLPCPSPALAWLAASFPPLPPAHRELAPLFRVLPAEDYRRALKSDRSHMRGPEGGFRSEPPPWPPIGQEDGPGSNLLRFVDTTRPFLGEVLDAEALGRRLGRLPARG